MVYKVNKIQQFCSLMGFYNDVIVGALETERFFNDIFLKFLDLLKWMVFLIDNSIATPSRK